MKSLASMPFSATHQETHAAACSPERTGSHARAPVPRRARTHALLAPFSAPSAVKYGMSAGDHRL